MLTLELARIFKSVKARDLSQRMLERAKKRIDDAKLTNVAFNEGNMLQPDESMKSFDFVLSSFVLHLFSPEDEKLILKKFLSIAKVAVIIIDHPKKWGLMTALAEWIKSSYYDKYIHLDFRSIAGEIGAKSFEENEIADSSVMIFRA